MRLLTPFAILFLGMFLAFKSDHNRTYPTDFFDWPVKHPIRLSGTFGELRPNHFHAGVDVKSKKGAVGDPLYAAGTGSVSRIRVQAAGYGRVLFLDHPNGYTTVYAHMDEFNEAIEAYVRAAQYQQQQFEVDLMPEKGRFSLNRGDYIGKMGNTGSSGGPHLHFEIRDSYSEKPINPLLFGLAITDNLAPKLHQLKIYELTENDQEIKTEIRPLERRGASYGIKGDTVYVGTDRVGLGLKAYDHHDNVSNWNGIYGLKMEVDDSLIYQFTMESFAFDETRYLNAHLDFQDRVQKNSYFNRCFILPGNQLSIYQQVVNRGLIRLAGDQPRKVNIQVWDVAGNATNLTCWIKLNSVTSPPEKELYNYLLAYDEEHLVKSQGGTLHFPIGSLYEDLALDFRVSEDASFEYYSPVYHLHNHLTPIHQYFSISVVPSREIPADKRDKAVIAYCTPSGRVYNAGGIWEEDRLVAKVNALGDYAVMLDQKPPVISNQSFKYDLRGRTSFSLKISDNLATTRLVNDLSYSATIDGAWVLMSYDKKSNQLRHYLDPDLPAGEHIFRLEVKDPVGNMAVYEQPFRR